MRVVKCLFGMLSQRMVYVTSLIGCINLNVRKQEDMSRTEELNTKLRTLSYDHERLMSMHRVAIEKAANAEREMNLHKSRLE
jgi:outer membrane murein-binding lipoprotein Lpp